MDLSTEIGDTLPAKHVASATGLIPVGTNKFVESVGEHLIHIQVTVKSIIRQVSVDTMGT